ncbi:MAG: ABC transporter permease [Thermoanaerobaculia bacterium]
MLQDLRFAFRTLRKRSGTSVLVVLMLALGIGASTIVFSLVEALLLRPLELADPQRLVRIYATQEIKGGDRMRVTEGAFYDWRQRSRTFEALVAARNTGLSVTDSEQPLNPRMRVASEDWFEVLGVSPTLGRNFLPEEYQGARVAILDFGFWQSYFGGDPGILERTIELAGEAYQIVGVMPAGFDNPAFPRPPVLWMPLEKPAEPDRRAGNMIVIGRLAEGASVADAGAEMEQISADLADLHPDTDAGRGARVLPLRDSLVERIRPGLLALFGAVGFVLLMACVNVANLLLARAVDRRREIGVRLAMGASRRHLLRQLLTESLVVGGMAAGLGLLLAFWSIEPLLSLTPTNTNVPLLDQVRLDARVMAFAVTVALATSVVFGLLPMLQAMRVSGGALVAGSRGGHEPGRKRLRSSLVVVEIAVSLVLLIGAGLMVRTLMELKGLGVGFEPKNLVTVRTGARGPIYSSMERFNEFHRLVGDGLRRLPGVEAVGACEILPMFASFRPSTPVTTPDQLDAPGGSRPRAVPLRATVGYFEAFGQPILRGRGFTLDDRPDSQPVAVISRSLALQVWGDDGAVGRELLLGDDGSRSVRIVGVAGDLRGLVQAPEPPPILFLPHAQDPVPNMTFMLRTEVDAASIFQQSQETIWGISRDVPVFFNTTLEQIVADIEWQPRFVMQLLSAFALFALILAATGIFAVLSYEVAERTREIGVRVAVGAGRGDVVRLVLGNAARLTAAGLAIGVVAALALSRFLDSQLYGVGANDPVTYGALAAILALAALASSYLPALKATRVDPVEALRCE